MSDMAFPVCPKCNDILWYDPKRGHWHCDTHGPATKMNLLAEDLVIELPSNYTDGFSGEFNVYGGSW